MYFTDFYDFVSIKTAKIATFEDTFRYSQCQ